LSTRSVTPGALRALSACCKHVASNLARIEFVPMKVMGLPWSPGAEGVARVETTALFGDELPKEQVFFRAAHLFRLTSARVRKCEKIQEPVVHQPGERNDLMLRVFFL
jgi:hypothetical protein